MLQWLFGSNFDEPIPDKETRFSNIPIGQEFKKLNSETVYVKTSEKQFETAEDGWRCSKWYRVYEDFLVRI